MPDINLSRIKTERDVLDSANKMLECRRAAKSILGDKYDEVIKEWIAELEKAVMETKQPTLIVSLNVAKKIKERKPDCEAEILMLMAATVDLLESEAECLT